MLGNVVFPVDRGHRVLSAKIKIELFLLTWSRVLATAVESLTGDHPSAATASKHY